MSCPFIYAGVIAGKQIASFRQSQCLKEGCALYCNLCKRCGLVCYCVGMRVKTTQLMQQLDKDMDCEEE